jgi:hypothetical protein
MTCKSCAERRRKLAELKAAKKAKRQFIQAGAIGAVLKVSDLINGEVKEDDPQDGVLGRDDSINADPRP